MERKSNLQTGFLPLNQVFGAGSGAIFFGSCIRIQIRIRVKSWILVRIRIKVKNQELSRLNLEPWTLKTEAWRGSKWRPIVADSHHLDEEQNPDPDPH
jgi:hypothetical protein